MNHMLKYTALLAALGLLLLSACSNILAPLVVEPRANTGLQITITNGESDARTLYPSAHFSHYTLEFEYEGGGESYDTITLQPDAASLTVTDLPDGTWTVKATGWVTLLDTPYPAAEGQESITVSAGNFTSVSIAIRSTQDGGDGFLSYAVSFPDSVTNASLHIHDIGGWYGSYIGYSLTAPNDRSGSIQLAPGYHMMSVRLTTLYRTITWSEVILIHSHMETVAWRNFTEDDLTKFIVLGGELNVTTTIGPVDYVEIQAYSDPDYMNFVGYTHAFDDRWDMTLTSVNPGTTLYLRMFVNVSGSWLSSRNIGSVTVQNGLLTTYNINETFSAVALSGTAHITVNGELPTYVYIYAYYTSDNGYYYDFNCGQSVVYPTESDSWQMAVDPFPYAGTVRFTLYISMLNADDSWSYFNKETGVSERVIPSSTAFSDIDLSLAITTITVSGTADITINSEAPYFTFVWLRGESVWVNSNSMYLADNPGDNSWRITLESFDTPTDMELWVYASSHDGRYFESYVQSITLYNTDETCNISVALSDITLSGTVRVNSAVPYSAWVYVYNAENDQYLNGTEVDAYGNWQMILTAFGASTDVYFRVSGEAYYEQWFDAFAGTRTVYDSDISDIDLAINEVSISGRVQLNIPIIDTTWDTVYIRRVSDNGYIGSSTISARGEWAIKAWSGAGVEAYAFISTPDTSWRWFDVESSSFTLTGGNQAGIISYATVPTITLSGTVTINGETPSWSNIQLQRFDEDSGDWAWMKAFDADSDGNWKTIIQPFDTPTDVRIALYGSNPQGYNFNDTRIVSLGAYDEVINLDVIATGLISLSGTITGTIDGSPVSELGLGFYIEEVGGGSSYSAGADVDEYGNWEIQFAPSAMSRTITFSVRQNGASFENITMALPTVTTSGISLTVNASTRLISGTINYATADVYSARLYVFSADVYGWNDPAYSSYFLGDTYWEGGIGTWSVRVPSTAPNALWFMVSETKAISGDDIYFEYTDSSAMTTSAVNTQGSVTLNVNQMRSFDW